MMRKTILSLCIFSTALVADEFPIGKPVEQCGMEIAAAYLKPMDMDPAKDLQAEGADIHLEADIHALKDNKNGFSEGEWIPYLHVDYELKNLGNGAVQKGSFIPMVAKDGPHYGVNVPMEKDKSKKFDKGNYELTFFIKSPDQQGMRRHTDDETGVDGMCSSVKTSYRFEYKGSLYDPHGHKH